MRVFSVILLASLLCPHSRLYSQQEPQPQQSGRTLCFRGRPTPTCRSFWITEAGYAYRLTGPENVHRHYFDWELGLMANVGSRSAVGGTLYAGILAEEGYRWGLRARYRHWLSSSTSLELSPGILIGVGDREDPGYVGGASLNFQDRWALVSHWEVVSVAEYWGGIRQGTRREVAWHGGVKLGSRPALYGVAAQALVTLIGFFIFAATFDAS